MEPSETGLRRGDSWRLGAEDLIDTEARSGSKHGLLVDFLDSRGIVGWVKRAIGEEAGNSWEETGSERRFHLSWT